MQLKRLSSLRVRLAVTVLLAITPALLLMHYTGLPWTGFVVGLVALGASWFGGEKFVLRQLRMINQAANRITRGDFTARSGLEMEQGEIGELARSFDQMADSLQNRGHERESAEKSNLNRTLQQTVVSALGQFALVGNDFSALLNQTVLLVAQTLEVEYCHVLEFLPGGESMVLRAGVGWKSGLVGKATVSASPETQAGFTLRAGEPVLIEKLASETRFKPTTLLVDHGVVSGVMVAISGQGRAFGVLGAHTTHERKFIGDEVQFLLAVGTVLAMAVERERTEAQLRQAQKMESVGQLAAGIAHDFNNMLTVIQGHSGMLLARTEIPEDLAAPAQAIYFAAERAAGLTRQLLMFSRKNVIQPRLLDLRQVVGNMSKMLHRLLGETVNLDVHGGIEPALIEADQGMVEQVIMNLAVNARDAMAGGGKLTISVAPTAISAAYVQTHKEARQGNFICLRVADTGSGMDAATMAHIFEPFFTTKEIGKGTGLGLATVYGIVKQHEGWVEVSSEVGAGTTFNVLFPASDTFPEAPVSEPGPAVKVPRGRETILIVEDEPVLRDMAHAILEQCGYKIFHAGSGVEALRVWSDHQNAIDLLLTDMVMPEGISGMDLAVRLHTTKPSLKIIVASGYSMDSLDPEFMSSRKARFLEKPYTHITLARAVRECLDN